MDPRKDVAKVYGGLLELYEEVPILSSQEEWVESDTVKAMAGRQRIFAVPDMPEIQIMAYIEATNLAKFGEPYIDIMASKYEFDRNAEVFKFSDTIQAVLLELFEIRETAKLARKAA